MAGMAAGLRFAIPFPFRQHLSRQAVNVRRVGKRFRYNMAGFTLLVSIHVQLVRTDANIGNLTVSGQIVRRMGVFGVTVANVAGLGAAGLIMAGQACRPGRTAAIAFAVTGFAGCQVPIGFAQIAGVLCFIPRRAPGFGMRIGSVAIVTGYITISAAVILAMAALAGLRAGAGNPDTVKIAVRGFAPAGGVRVG